MSDMLRMISTYKFTKHFAAQCEATAFVRLIFCGGGVDKAREVDYSLVAATLLVVTCCS